jgi:cell division protein FtsW
MPLEGRVLLLVTLALTAFGQVMVYSSSSAYALTHPEFGHDALYFVKRGLVWTLLGVVVMLVVTRMPIRWLRVVGPTLLMVSLVLLVAVLVPGVSEEIKGARRWIAVGPITVQPSELAKLGLLGTLAALLGARRRAPGSLREVLLPHGLVTALVCLLVLAEPDLGSALALALMVACVLVVAGTPAGLLLRLLVVGVGLVGVAIAATPYRRDRFLSFLDPWDAGQSSDGAYQVVQSMMAIGSGGLWGQGLGESVQKVNYIPEAHTDMIFAVIGEELGLVGSVLVIGAFAAFAWAGFTIALASRDRFAKLVAAGATGLIVGQAAINLGAVMGILPLTGIPLPLVSFGSSSRLVTLLMVGLLLSACRQTAAARAPVRSRPVAVPDPAPLPEPDVEVRPRPRAARSTGAPRRRRAPAARAR